MGPRLRSRGIFRMETAVTTSGTTASMGPRLRSRGILIGDMDAVKRETLLQWGRGCAAAESHALWDIHPWPFRFNGAAAAQPRNPQQAWREGRRAARFNGAAAAQPRNLIWSTSADASANASMGPRLRSRGIPEETGIGETPHGRFNGAAAAQPRNPRRHGLTRARWKYASMGPRLRSRGIVQASRTALRAPALQWGRGCAAAESDGRAVQQEKYSSFNGAAAAQPRNRRSWR